LGEAVYGDKVARDEDKVFLTSKIFLSGGGSSAGVFFTDGVADVQTIVAAEGVEGTSAAEKGHAAGGTGGLYCRVYVGRKG
jgi:hypothetical protein